MSIERIFSSRTSGPQQNNCLNDWAMQKETATGLRIVSCLRCPRRPGLCVDRDAESDKTQPRLLSLAIEAGAFNFVA